jgi:hypothetical protein
MYLNESVPARVRLEYWISFWRVDTSATVRGSSPRALQRSTWKAKVSEIERRITDIIKKDRKFLWIRQLRLFALSLFKLYVVEKKYDVDELLGSRAMFEQVFSEFWKDAHRELISAHYDAVERDKTTVFALARSDTRWSATREKFLFFLKQTAR